MKTYIYVANGYSYGGYGRYSIITVAQGHEKCPGWWNKKMKVLERTGLLYNGPTNKCEFDRRLKKIMKEYPHAIL